MVTHTGIQHEGGSDTQEVTQEVTQEYNMKVDSGHTKEYNIEITITRK